MLAGELTWDDVPMLIPEMCPMIWYGQDAPEVKSFRMITAAGLAMRAHFYAVGQLRDDDAIEAFPPVPEPTEEDAALAAVRADFEKAYEDFEARLTHQILYGSPDA